MPFASVIQACRPRHRFVSHGLTQGRMNLVCHSALSTAFDLCGTTMSKNNHNETLCTKADKGMNFLSVRSERSFNRRLARLKGVTLVLLSRYLFQPLIVSLKTTLNVWMPIVFCRYLQLDASRDVQTLESMLYSHRALIEKDGRIECHGRPCAALGNWDHATPLSLPPRSKMDKISHWVLIELVKFHRAFLGSN